MRQNNREVKTLATIILAIAFAFSAIACSKASQNTVFEKMTQLAEDLSAGDVALPSSYDPLASVNLGAYKVDSCTIDGVEVSITAAGQKLGTAIDYTLQIDSLDGMTVKFSGDEYECEYVGSAGLIFINGPVFFASGSYEGDRIILDCSLMFEVDSIVEFTFKKVS